MTYSELFLSIKNRPENEWSIAEDDKHRLEWYVREWDDYNILAFQESNGSKDWKDNFNILPSKCTCCSGTVVMSKGTNDAYKIGKETIHSQIEQKKANGKPWIVTGWSLGGGMAIRGAIDINHTFGIHSNLITFGAPAILWTRDSVIHAAQCCHTVHQFAHRGDIVPKVAPGAQHIEATWIGAWFPFAEFGTAGWHTQYDKWCNKLGKVYTGDNH